jgi:hypothetical protein
MKKKWKAMYNNNLIMLPMRIILVLHIEIAIKSKRRAHAFMVNADSNTTNIFIRTLFEYFNAFQLLSFLAHGKTFIIYCYSSNEAIDVVGHFSRDFFNAQEMQYHISLENFYFSCVPL